MENKTIQRQIRKEEVERDEIKEILDHQEKRL